jgi:hypothetical protein
MSTWTNSETKKCWPKDFLPKDIPEARIMTFGYNADAAFGIRRRILWTMQKIFWEV